MPDARKLLHRWFVEYNPTYVLSAALVLIGLTLLDRALSTSTSAASHLIVSAITELYALSLVGAAALLVRIRQRRASVFVALLAVLYQSDLSLSTESYALLGRVGIAASLVWVALFVAKLVALGAALRLRVSPSAYAVPTMAALGLATIPHLSRRIDAIGPVIALWVFAVFAAAAWSERRVVSEQPLDAWGATVLRRALRATWLSWAGLFAGHALFWCAQFRVDARMMLPALLLLATRGMKRESHVAMTTVAVVAITAMVRREWIPVAAFAAAATFVLHALRRPTWFAHEGATPLYRGAQAIEPPTFAFTMAPWPSRGRELAWSTYALHFGAWSLAPHPWQHVGLLDVAVVLAIALLAWRVRSVVVALPLGALLGHFAVQIGLLRAPSSTLEWAISTLSLGFATLAASVVVSYRTRTSALASRSDLASDLAGS